MLIYSIYSDISFYKKGTFHQKKGRFRCYGEMGGGHVPPVPPSSHSTGAMHNLFIDCHYSECINICSRRVSCVRAG